MINYTASFQGIPATGNRIELRSIIMARIKDGKVIEEREKYDTLGMMQQPGMELKPKQAEKE